MPDRPHNPPPEGGPQPPEDAPLRWYRDRRKLIGTGLVAVVAVVAIALVAWNQLKRPADVSNPDVTFRHQKAPEPPIKPHHRKSGGTVAWPTFRLNRQRTGYLPAKGIHPPYRRVWRYGGKPLLEFPPVVVKGVLYFVDNDGFAHALRARNGRRIWQRRIARLNAATPTYADGRLYLVNMEPGQAMALRADNGKRIWRKSLPCRSESSPVVVHHTVYFGCENGMLYALRARNGREVWSTGLAGAIKAAPAYADGTLYVGDYGGAMTAVRAKTGEIQWQTRSLGPGLGQAGAFYSTPAVAWGRVYAGNNDSRVYSFDAGNGALAWTHSTGGWVYSGPSAAKVPGTPASIYIGSFDGNVYALNAKTGETRWTFPMGGRIVGSLSVIGRTVYAATFDGTTIHGISAESGRSTFSYHTGAYMPAISDGRLLYLIGYSSIHALKPISRKAAARARHRKAEAKSGGNGHKNGKRNRQGGQDSR